MERLRKELIHDVLEVFGLSLINQFSSSTESETAIRQLLKVDALRRKVVQVRLEKALKLGRIRTMEFNPLGMIVTKSGKNAIEHNLEGLAGDLSSARSARLIKPLSCLEVIKPLAINQRPDSMLNDIEIETPLKVLCVGPRNEAEPLILWAYGFKLEDITCVDLISYSEMVTLGDMHSLQYADSTFDVVFSSCTLVYSRNIDRAAKELKRVAKPGAIFAISQDIPNREYRNESKSLYHRELCTPESIVELFYAIEEVEILYRHFVESNLDLPNGCTSACIFRNRWLANV